MQEGRERKPTPLPLDGSASVVMMGARIASNQFDHRYVGTEHLLLSFLTAPNPFLKKLEETGLDHRKVTEAVEFIVGRGEQPWDGERVPTSRVRKILDAAQERARREGKLTVTASHLFLMLVGEKEGNAAGILEALEVEKHKLLRVLQPPPGSA